MAIERVWIETGCIMCKLCEDTCPEVFEAEGETIIVKADADIAGHEDSVKEAAVNCPVEVIKYE